LLNDVKCREIAVPEECYSRQWQNLDGSGLYQRRTLTGTGVTKKTAQGCTAKNLRMKAAM